MSVLLSQGELRVIGCLIEKSLTTPDQYPLSINALTNACNQKSSRDPVMSLSDNEVQNIVDSLNVKNLILKQAGATTRVSKYKHRFCNTEFSDLQFDIQQLAIICVLFLRGAQTPGELRSRTNRLCEFNNVQQTEDVLNAMCQSTTPPLVVKLSREAGRRESRYAHCFSDDESINTVSNVNIDLSISTSTSTSTTENENVNSDERFIAIQQQVDFMQLEIDELRERLDKLNN